jgi:CO dehydrogenase nickel-insertion accessory protein CooC1
MDTENTSKNFTRVLEQLSSLYDIVLLDVPSTADLEFEITNVALFKSDVIIAVMDENVSCIGAYNRLQRNLSYVGIPTNKIKVIMNKRTNITYPASVFKSLDINLEVLLPYDVSIVEAGLRGLIYITKGSSSSVTAAQFLESIEELRDDMLIWGGYQLKSKAEKKEKKVKERPVKEKRHAKNKNKEIEQDEVSDDSGNAEE